MSLVGSNANEMMKVCICLNMGIYQNGTDIGEDRKVNAGPRYTPTKPDHCCGWLSFSAEKSSPAHSLSSSSLPVSVPHQLVLLSSLLAGSVADGATVVEDASVAAVVDSEGPAVTEADDGSGGSDGRTCGGACSSE